jgi:hypothetical protein
MSVFLCVCITHLTFITNICSPQIFVINVKRLLLINITFFNWNYIYIYIYIYIGLHALFETYLIKSSMRYKETAWCYSVQQKCMVMNHYETAENKTLNNMITVVRVLNKLLHHYSE